MKQQSQIHLTLLKLRKIFKQQKNKLKKHHIYQQQSKTWMQIDAVNLMLWEIAAGGSGLQGQFELCSEFKASYLQTCLAQDNRNRNDTNLHELKLK